MHTYYPLTQLGIPGPVGLGPSPEIRYARLDTSGTQIQYIRLELGVPGNNGNYHL